MWRGFRPTWRESGRRNGLRISIPSYYDGLWSGVALRTTEGAHVPLYPDPTKNTYVDLEVLRGVRISVKS